MSGLGVEKEPEKNNKNVTIKINPANIPKDALSSSLIKNSSNAVKINLKPLSSEAQVIMSKLVLLEKTINNQFEYLNQKIIHIEDHVKANKEITKKAAKLLENTFDSKSEEFKFPISNQEQLDELELKLSDVNVKRKLTIKLTNKYKHRQLKHAIKDMFMPLFLKDYSVTGRQKKNFSSLIVYSVLENVFPTNFYVTIVNVLHNERSRAYRLINGNASKIEDDGNDESGDDNNEDEQMEDDDDE